MEATTSAVEDSLINSLDFKINQGRVILLEDETVLFSVKVVIHTHLMVSVCFVSNLAVMGG